MKADLFNRAAWQLRTRGGVKVYATLAGLGQLPDRDQIAVYEDLARYTNFAGVVLPDTLSENLTQKLALRLRELRGPQVHTALKHSPGLHVNDTGRMQRELDSFLLRAQNGYDWAVIGLPMAGSSASPADVNAMIDGTLAQVARIPKAMQHTVFTLQPNRSDKAGAFTATTEASSELVRNLLRLQLGGAASVGYGGDDFAHDQPRLDRVRPVLSTAWYPYK
jgi:biofilm PGA synthesis lipoprotein PgaB